MPPTGRTWPGEAALSPGIRDPVTSWRGGLGGCYVKEDLRSNSWAHNLEVTSSPGFYEGML